MALRIGYKASSEQFAPRELADYAVLAEELSKFNAATSSCFGIHSDITAPYIVALGTQEQKQRRLPGVAAGRLARPSGARARHRHDGVDVAGAGAEELVLVDGGGELSHDAPRG